LASEARLVALGVTDAASIADIIWPAFQRAVASSVEIDYAQETAASRALARVRDEGSDNRPDVVFLLNPESFLGAGFAEPAEPPIADRYPAAWAGESGNLWPLYMEPTVAIYNAYYTTAPAAWRDLATVAPGRLVFEAPWVMSTTGPALAELSGALDPETWQALLRGLVGGHPRLVSDNERAVLGVGTGTSWMGLSNLRFARRVRAESPVRHVFLDPVPCVPAFGVLVHGARNRRLARTFLEWLTSEDGQSAFAAAGRVPCLPSLGIPAFSRLTGNRDVRPLFGTVPWVTGASTWAERFRSMFAESEAVPMS